MDRWVHNWFVCRGRALDPARRGMPSIEPDRRAQPGVEPVDQPQQSAAPEAEQPRPVAAVQQRVAELREPPAYRQALNRPNFPSEPKAS